MAGVSSLVPLQARADLVGTLGTVVAPGTVAFHNSDVQPGPGHDPYNFLDQWNFTLAPAASVSSIAAAISFSSPFDTFGVTSLQLNLLSNPPSGPPIVSWSSVATPSPSVTEVTAFITPSSLPSGDYSLEVRGIVTEPGSYSGSLIASPVPLPTAVLPFLGGLFVLSATSAKKKRRG
jgi:hypothetical protein